MDIITFEALKQLCEAILAHVFSDILLKKTSSPVAHMRFEAVRQRAVAQLLSASEPYFDQSLSEDRASTLVAELRNLCTSESTSKTTR